MTESEWVECEVPTPMLDFLRDKASDRKWRLFACACCRSVWHLLTYEGSHAAVGLAERYADGEVTEQERASAYDNMWGTAITALDPSPVAAAVGATASAADVYSQATVLAKSPSIPFDEMKIAVLQPYAYERRRHARIFREIFGNPFRPVTINPFCLTPTVTSLAQAAYEERSLPSGELHPDRLAVLSDALEEARCDNEDILDHLRSHGPHVRGCWAVDLLLGKK